MKPTGCVRCGAAGNHVLHPLELVACDGCTHAWLQDESCSVEAVEAVVGTYDGGSRTYHRHCEAFDAELLKRTLEWAKSAREAAA